MSEIIVAEKKAIMEKRSKMLNKLIKLTLYNSTAQSIFKIMETPFFNLKIFLIFCLISSSGFCSYLLITLIMAPYSK